MNEPVASLEADPKTCPMCGARMASDHAECMACGERIPSSAPTEPPRRIRWRIIPTVLLALLGGLYVLGSSLAFVFSLYFWLTKGRLLLEPFFTNLVFLYFGVALLLAARWCWRKRWLHFTVAIATIAASAASLNYLIWLLGPGIWTRQ